MSSPDGTSDTTSDDEIRLDRLQLRLDVTLAIEHSRDRARGSAKRGAERFGLDTRAARDDEREPSLIGKELRRWYDNIVKEPVPDELLDLLNQIDKRSDRESES